MDKILKMFFDAKRWEYALEKGVDKDINKAQLIRLTSPETRLAMYSAIRDGRYEIAPPHTAKIPKDNGEYRTVYINEPIDRVVLSICNDLLFDLMPEMVHPHCRSYQKGTGCGKIVQDISKECVNIASTKIGWKSDLSKYFDSVPLRFIDEAFDKVEAKYGHSALIDVLRKYYHSDWFFDTEGNLCQSYQSLKQGCAVASWLADVVLYHIDERISQLDVRYERYSDDCLCLGDERNTTMAMSILVEELAIMDMKLNPKKVEFLNKSMWFKFLGYSIKGDMITLSKNRIKTFQKEIEHRTIKNRKTTYQRAINSVNSYLYKGNGEFSWATQILPICNVRADIDELNKFVMDALRAVKTGKRRIGGLGYVRNLSDKCVLRGKGRNVKANREKAGGRIDGYLSLGCMQNAIKTRRAVYNTLVAQL